MKKIDLLVNGNYICSSNKYKTCKQFVERIKKDGFVEYASIPNKILILHDDDKIVAHFAK